MSSPSKPPTLSAHLSSLSLPPTRKSLQHTLLPALLSAISTISSTLRHSQVSSAGTSNTFGDSQLNVDVLAEQHIRSAIAACACVATASSEEDPIEKAVNSVEDGEQKYTIAFDPLDGSSIIGSNWTVGTIIGIWTGTTALNQHPENQVAAILGVYGPRTTAIIALRLPGTGTCFEVALSGNSNNAIKDIAESPIIKPSITLSPPPNKTKYFSPANLRSAAENTAYSFLITRYISQKYTLRYSGGLVPDIVHMLVKGHGIYISPVTSTSPAKLRRLYELLPIALVVECVGGKALDDVTGQRILAREVRDCDERGGLVCGNVEEVEEVVAALALRN